MSNLGQISNRNQEQNNAHVKEATSKVIPLFPRNDGNSRYKLYQTDPKLILTVIMIFDIPLCNSKGTLPFFFKKAMFAKMLEHF